MVRPTPVMTLGRREPFALRSLALPLTGLIGQMAHTAGETIRVSFATPDPTKMRGGGLEYSDACYVFSRLIQLKTKLQAEPDLATSWEPSGDMQSWTFKLRTDVKFHNGKTVTTDDVVLTYRRLQDQEIGAVLWASADFVTKIAAVDLLTIPSTLNIRYGDLPALTTRYPARIVCESAMDTFTTNLVSTGPFQFAKYKPRNQMILERKADHFISGVPRIDKAVLQITPAATTAVAGLQSGDLDVFYNLPSERVDKVRNSNTVCVEEVTTGTPQDITMNCDMKPFDNPKVRQAADLMVDKPAFANIATLGHGTPTVAPIPSTHPYFRKDLLTAQNIPAAKRQVPGNRLRRRGRDHGLRGDLGQWHRQEGAEPGSISPDAAEHRARQLRLTRMWHYTIHPVGSERICYGTAVN